MKFIFTGLLLLVIHYSFAQVAGATFYGSSPMRYKGTTLKVISTPDPYRYFILDKDISWTNPSNTYLPGKQSLASDPYKLFGKEFLVTDVTKHPFDQGVFILEMKDLESDQPVFYYYDPANKNSFYMQVIKNKEGEVGSIDEGDKVDYCSEIVADKDKFTGKVTYNSPYKPKYHILIYKYIAKGKPPYYRLGLYTTSSVVSTNSRGVIILLDDKTKISKPQEEVDVEVRQYDTHGYGDFEYSAMISLTQTDIARLLKHRITDFRLYFTDQEVDEGEGSLNIEYLKCLIKKK